ncbi:hypothetical protein [Sphingomonas sp. CROZ-RG-20F-R02-07]|uniref:hypothetical protein n=1 Tax=Sphingomonas sp. CROZ-RG-20F-R02-07 TaxID=2914832 RepID=UPI001F59E46E|nr:hypothetical protein [Sphingomonas sp. CROZ-RG-20F-R02-07]
MQAHRGFESHPFRHFSPKLGTPISRWKRPKACEAVLPSIPYGVRAFGIDRNLFDTCYSSGWQIYGALGLLHYTTPNAYHTVGGFAQFKG